MTKRRKLSVQRLGGLALGLVFAFAPREGALAQADSIDGLRDTVSRLNRSSGWTEKNRQDAISTLSSFFDLYHATLEELVQAEKQAHLKSQLLATTLPAAGLLLAYHATTQANLTRVLEQFLYRLLHDPLPRNLTTPNAALTVTEEFLDNGNTRLRFVHYKGGVIRYRIVQEFRLDSRAPGGWAFLEGHQGQGVLLRDQRSAEIIARAPELLHNRISLEDLQARGYSRVLDVPQKPQVLAKYLVEVGQPFRVRQEFRTAAYIYELIHTTWKQWATHAQTARWENGRLIVESTALRSLLKPQSLQTVTTLKISAGLALVVGGALLLSYGFAEQEAYLSFLQTLHRHCSPQDVLSAYETGCVGRVLLSYPDLDTDHLKNALISVGEWLATDDLAR